VNRLVRGAAARVIAAGVWFAATASAHISLEQGGTHKSRYGDANLKDGPCGLAGGTRGTNVYTYAPGETITVKLVETIPHPSYFRFAFDANGDGDFKEPASIKPIDPTRPCPINPGDKCGSSDFNNSPTVLMDNLNPHLAGQAGPNYSWQVTLPDVECDNCTLQVIQVMEDNFFHGDFNPVQGDPNDNPYIPDIYHQCIDLVLTRNAPAGAGGDTSSGGGGASTGSAGAESAGASGGGAGGTGSPSDASGGAASGGDVGSQAGSGSSASNGAAAGSTGSGGEGTTTAFDEGSSGSAGSCALHTARDRSGYGLLALAVAAVATRRRRAR
jgi:hypothetical protein